MTVEYVEMPDVEAGLVAELTNDPHLTDFTPSVHVGADMVGYTKDQTWIMLTRIGGKRNWPAFDRPIVQFDIYAADRGMAEDVAQACRATVFSYQHSRFASMSVGGVEEFHGMIYLPDPLQEGSVPRYLFALEIIVRPNPS